MERNGVQWSGRDLRGLAWKGTSLCGANLSGCRLDDADLREADLWGANLALASLRRADLRGARLSCASFAGADLRAARMAGAELTFCDLGGAHLACVDLGRARTHGMFAAARSMGCPSFADALSESSLEASWLKSGPALLAVDAALDVSADPEAEIGALLQSSDWRAAAVGAMAVIRCAGHERLRSLLVALLTPGHLGAVAAVALLRTGHPAGAILERCPALGAHGTTQHRGALVWGDLVRRRLSHVDAWPSPDAQPPPRPSLLG